MTVDSELRKIWRKDLEDLEKAVGDLGTQIFREQIETSRKLDEVIKAIEVLRGGAQLSLPDVPLAAAPAVAREESSGGS